MISRNLITKVAPVVRSIHTSSALKGHHPSTRGVFGSNVPFPVNNKYVLLGLFCVFFSSGLALPFITLRHKILAANPPE